MLIGDPIHDFEVANEIGIDCMLVANGHQSKSRLEEQAGEKGVVFYSLEQLIAM